jgi:outer membrane protein W
MSAKLFSLLAGVLLLTTAYRSSFAQKAFEKSNVLVNGGVVIFDGPLAVAASVEYGITDRVGAGIRGYFARTGNGYNIFNSSVYANYHFTQRQRLDPFAGLMLDKTFYTQNDRGVTPSSQTIGLNAQAGVRYFFTQRFGVYVQALLPFRRGAPVRGTSLGGEVGISLKL